MNATTTRRAVLAGAAALPALAIPAIASGAADPADQVDRLYRQYIAMVGEAKAISRTTEEATAALPEWARMGPERVDSDGKFSGTTVGWPIREDLTYPAPGMLRNARPGTRDLS